MKLHVLSSAGLLASLAISACNCDSGGLIDVRANLVIDAETIDFGEVPVGDFRVRGLKLQNKGQAALDFTRFDLDTDSDEFLFVTPVPERFGIEESLDFNIQFGPNDVGEETGTLFIEADDGQGLREITIRGVGVMSDVVATTDGERCGDADGSVSFGQVTPGQTANRTITVRATGTAPVQILSAVVEPGTSGEFTIEGPSAPRTLAPGEELQLPIHYTPSDGGPDSGAFVITTDAATNPSIRISTCGEGVAPAICAAPLNFGRVAVGTSQTKTMTITSCGLQPVDLTALALANDAQHPTSPAYRITNLPSLPRTMQPGETADLEIELTVSALGPAQGWVKATSTAYGSPESFFSIYGEGGEPCGIQVLPQTLTFTNVAAGTTAQQVVVVANNGASACSVSRIEIASGSAQFSLQSPPATPVTIPSGGSITLGVVYTPSNGMTQDMGTLEVEESGAVSSVTLLGNPVLADGCQVEIRPPAINFGVVAPGTTRSMGAEVFNISDEPCFLRGVSLAAGTHPDFTNSSPNLGLIFPGRSKMLAVTYTPTAQGAATGTLNVNTSDVDTPSFQVPIFASAAPTNICVTPRSLPFGPISASATQTFNITACGTQAVTVTALDWTTPDSEFSVQTPPAMPFTLQPGQNQVITVLYRSLDMDGDTAIVTVRSSDLAEPAIDVTCTGGPEIVPASAGRYLYYWQIPNPIGGDVVRLPLQGATVSEPYWGPRNGKACTGCHSVSPDGRYVALIELPSFRVIDTTTDIALSIPNGGLQINFLTWNPDVNTNPPYQYAYDDGSDIHVAGLFVGDLSNGNNGKLRGGDDPVLYEEMPTWGTNGKIAFVAGTSRATSNNGQGSWGFNGPTDIKMVDATGGTAVLVPGASNNGKANYYPQFSPNGLWIAFTQSDSAQSTIAAADAQLRLAPSDLSGNIRALPTLNGTVGASSYPTWSVDGRFLSFSSNRPGGAGDWDIYIAPIDPMTGADSPAVNVADANTSAFEHSAQWSP